MKVGIDCRLWNQTGVGRYIRNLVYELLEIDNKNDYVLFGQSSESSEINRFLSSHNKRYKFVKADVKWHSIREQFEFPKILNAHKLDLMHFTYFSVPIFYKGKYVVTIHDLIPYHLSTGRASTLPYPLYLAKLVSYKFVVKKSAAGSVKIIVPLESVKIDVVKTLKIDSEKIVVTREGFEMRLFKGASDIEVRKLDKYFLYVGNAYPHKNLTTLIKGFDSLISHESERVKLIIVGKKDFFYERLLSEVSLASQKNIKFLFDVSDKDLEVLYKNAISLVSASKMEGFGLVPLEAMSNGCLPVVSNIESFKEVCGNAAIYFDQYDPADIANKLSSALNMDKNTRRQFISNGKSRILHFSWKETARQTLGVYESCNSV